MLQQPRAVWGVATSRKGTRRNALVGRGADSGDGQPHDSVVRAAKCDLPATSVAERPVGYVNRSVGKAIPLTALAVHPSADRMLSCRAGGSEWTYNGDICLERRRLRDQHVPRHTRSAWRSRGALLPLIARRCARRGSPVELSP